MRLLPTGASAFNSGHNSDVIAQAAASDPVLRMNK
jgi:hypothetical protein